MFAKFKYDTLPLGNILLDDRNPRIVTPQKLQSQEEILQYLFEHEDLSSFISRIAAEGRNEGAERPYVVKSGAVYTVVEGNNRIAAYKVLAGLMEAPDEFKSSVPAVAPDVADALKKVDCSIAPSRDALLPIMANAHFGQGDKSKWGYLGSRKAVYEERALGKDIPQLAKAFDRTEAQIRELILEYQLYKEALALSWTKAEKEKLLSPKVKFNPPVRFLETEGHKEKVGLSYDKVNLKISFDDPDAKNKLKHLVKRLVIDPKSGLKAVSSYDDVFAGYGSSTSGAGAGSAGSAGAGGGGVGGGAGAGAGGAGGTSAGGSSGTGGGTGSGAAYTLKPGALFGYAVKVPNSLLKQLMEEAKSLNTKSFPAAGTFLMRNIVETILKHIIDEQKANPASKSLDLEGALNLCISSAVAIPNEDRKVLSQFKKDHLDYLNTGSHGSVIPNHARLMQVRDTIDVFVKKYT